MGRESQKDLEESALSFLAAVHTDRGLDAALFLRRSGLVLASWTREGIRLEIVSVMAATMLASIDAIVETLGAAIPQNVAVDSGDHQIIATKLGSQAFLVVIAPKTVSRSVVRKTIRELVAHLTSTAKTNRSRLDVTERNQRVNVRPPQ